VEATFAGQFSTKGCPKAASNCPIYRNKIFLSKKILSKDPEILKRAHIIIYRKGNLKNKRIFYS